MASKQEDMESGRGSVKESMEKSGLGSVKTSMEKSGRAEGKPMSEAWTEREKEGKTKRPITEEQYREIERLAETIRYGSVNLVFQDGVLVQIERHEKIRVR